MPAAYQGTVFRPAGSPILDLRPPDRITPEEQRRRLELLDKLNRSISRRTPGTRSWPLELSRTSWRTACRPAPRR
jgi:hypothetical protein